MPARYLQGLQCEECNRAYNLSSINFCEFDFGPLRVKYDYEKIRKTVSRDLIQSRNPNMWRYIEFLPIDGDQIPSTNSETGYTPLRKADNLAKALGVEELYLKVETSNPTHSFKDRVVEVAVAKAIEFEYEAIGCASTGNLANSVAAHAAHAGLKAYILIPHDLEPEKVRATSIFNPVLIGVEGSYDDANRLGSEIADNHPEIPFVNINLRAYYGDGSRTVGFEIAEQLGWRAPAHLVVPTAGASLIQKTPQGFNEFYKTGLIDKPNTRIYSAQGAGCAPVVNAILDESPHFTPIPRDKINTIAKSLAIGNPADGNYALEKIRASGGWGEKATDDEIMEGVDLLAQTEGIWAETASGVTIAVLKKLIDQGRIPKDDGTIVALITGDGFKTPDATKSPGLETIIEPSLKEFERVIQT